MTSDTKLSPGAPGPETRISTVIGDRLCIKCQFNLSGQPVLRETVYGMAIVRCPECSTVASLQEYPLLGKWAGRFAAALAAIWLLMLVGGTFATAGILFGMSEGCFEMGGIKLAEHIAKEHAAWFETATTAERASIVRMYGGGAVPTQLSAYSWIDSVWWKRQDPTALVAALGGPARATSTRMFNVLTMTVFAALVMGAVWSIFLLHVRRWRLFIFALLPIALALVFAYLSSQSSSQMAAWGPVGTVYAIHAAQSVLWTWIISVALASSFIAFCIGAWFGRPLIRWLARLLLPPRMIGSLAYLWIAEGRSPPRPRKR